MKLNVSLKTINVPLFKKLQDKILFLRDNNFMSHFEGHFEGAKNFFDPFNCPECREYCPKKKIMS
jgi:hypothetical protein